jgi:acetyl-CoA carboxylase carboxyl transferase subunit beta
MAWFKRKEKITTATEDKMDVPKVFGISLLEKLLMLMSWNNLFVSPEDGFHVRIGSSTYFEILFDNNEFVELNTFN